jgi:hypothetical protein
MYNEQEIISLIMEGLQSDLRHYLECRGTPLTYTDLVSKIQVYEERGLPRYNTTPSNTSPPALASTSWSSSLHTAPTDYHFRAAELCQRSPYHVRSRVSRSSAS